VARWLEQSVVVSSLSNSSVVDFRHLVSLLGSFVDHVYTPTATQCEGIFNYARGKMMMSAPAKHVARELAAFAFAAGSLGFAAYAHDTATPCTGLYTCTLEMLHDHEYQVTDIPHPRPRV
jgi:hypothetical protein